MSYACSKYGFLAGAAAVDITPKVGTHLSGDIGRYRPAEVMADQTFAKTVVIQVGDRRICLVSLDLTIVCKEYADSIRAGAGKYGISSDAVIVHATQTHSAPSAGSFMLDPDFKNVPEDKEWIRGGDSEYSEHVVACALNAIEKAVDNMQPVRIGAASGIEGRLAFNRRAVMKDGSVGMPGPVWNKPLGPDWIKYIEGPVDPELGVICIQNENMHMIALLPHYTCHPVHVFGKGRIVSADWPGVWSSELRKTHGDDCVSLVINGCCGNINPWDPFDPDYPNDHIRMGKMLADTANRVIEQAHFYEEPVLDYRTMILPIPIRTVDQTELMWAESILEKYPSPLWTDSSETAVEWDWMRAAEIMSVELIRKREQTLKYEIQAMRIGNIAIVALPGEPFVEGQLAIKMASRADFTYVAHCCSQYVGYIPTKQAVARGGHEINTSYWAKLVPEALDMIIENAVSMTNSMF